MIWLVNPGKPPKKAKKSKKAAARTPKVQFRTVRTRVPVTNKQYRSIWAGDIKGTAKRQAALATKRAYLTYRPKDTKAVSKAARALRAGSSLGGSRLGLRGWYANPGKRIAFRTAGGKIVSFKKNPKRIAFRTASGKIVSLKKNPKKSPGANKSRLNKKGAKAATRKERSMAKKSKSKKKTKAQRRAIALKNLAKARAKRKGKSPKRVTKSKSRSKRRSKKISRWTLTGKTYTRFHKNPSSVMESIKFAAPIVASLYAGRIIANGIASRIPGVDKLGQHAAPVMSLAMLFAGHYGMKYAPAMIKKHSTAIMAGLGINFINTAIATYAPANIKGMIGVGDSGVYDQALAEYVQTSSYESVDGYEEVGALEAMAGDREALVPHRSTEEMVEPWSPAEAAEAGGIFAHSGWGY